MGSDLLLAIVKKIVRKRKKKNDLKIIICSATINATLFLNYFIGNNNKRKKYDDDDDDDMKGVIISIDGRQYPVDIYYLKEPCCDYVISTVNTAIDIIYNNNKIEDNNGGILCFLPTSEDIDKAIQLTEDILQDKEQQKQKQKDRNIILLP